MGSPFGLKGFVKVKPFSGEIDHFSRLDKIILKQGEKEEIREVAEIVLHGGSRGVFRRSANGSSEGRSLLIRFTGIDNPEAAGVLRGAEIIAGREYAAPLKEGEYYVEDLKGLEVISPTGESLGRITNVVEGGGGDLAEVELPSGERRFVPFRKEFFADIDLEKGKMALLEPWMLDR